MSEALHHAREAFMGSAGAQRALATPVSNRTLQKRIEWAFACGYEAAERAALVRRCCSSKVRHASKAKAIASASNVAGARHLRGMHVYHCGFCAGWHLTKAERPNG